MKVKETKRNSSNVEIVEFNSLNEFYKYICETPFNDSFRWEKHSSVEGTRSFTGTKNFEEAVELFKNGWTDMSKKLTQKIKANEIKMQPMMKARNKLDVCGYQAIVPLYLQGVPNSMINKKMVATKQKVVTINKCIQYACMVSTEQIIDESIKAMQIIKKVEAQGIRCNLNIVEHIKSNNKEYIFKIRVKNATEKLNVSKLAVPLVNPSMLRRLLFRLLEVYPNVPSSFVCGYGRPAKAYETKEIITDEYVIPSIFEKSIDDIKSLDDLK